MDMDHPAADRSREEHRPPWMSDGETTMPSPSPAWPPSPTESDYARIYSPPHRYYTTMMMGLDVAGDGNLQESQGEPTISAASLSVRWSPQAPSPQPRSPTMDVLLWSFSDRPISSPEELGPAPAEASHAGLLCISGNFISLVSFHNALSKLVTFLSKLIIERWECTVMFGSKEHPELVFDAEALKEIWGMHYSNSPFRGSFPGQCRANKVKHVEQTSMRLIMGCSSSAEVDNAVDKSSSSILGATTLLGIENPRQRQDKATASLSPLSSRKKIVEISNVKSHRHVSNASGGDNNEVTELVGHKDVEADKPAVSVSRKRRRSQGRKSKAWPHFPNVERNADTRIIKAQCTYCGAWLVADSKKDGTSRLLRHITDHHDMDLDASPETNKKRAALAIKTKNQSRDQTAVKWGGIVPDEVPNEVIILDSQDSVGKVSTLEGQMIDKINSASQEEIMVDEIHEVADEEVDDATAGRDECVLQRRPAERNGVDDLDDIREVRKGREEKRLKRSARTEEMTEKFPQMREEESARLAKQAEEESARLAREKEAAESNDFSIKRCISVLNTLEVTKEEKAKAYAVFSKSKENREVFICGYEADVGSTLIWLRNEMV